MTLQTTSIAFSSSLSRHAINLSRIARRAIAEGGAYLNNVRVTAQDAVPSVDDLLYGRFLVIRRGKTSYRSIEGAYRVIDRQKLLGVVFNDVKPMLFHTYYNRGYYNYSHDSQYLYPSRKTRVDPKNYLES